MEWKGSWAQWAILILMILWIALQGFSHFGPVRDHPVLSRLVVLAGLLLVLGGITLEKENWQMLLPLSMGAAVVGFIYWEHHHHHGD